MRTVLAAALLLMSMAAGAADGPKPIAIAIEPLGDRDAAVVARVFFRFANPRQVTEAGLFLEGSITQGGGVPRNFRFAVPRKGDKFVWHDYLTRNGKILRHRQWAVLPDQRNQMAMDHAFAEGEVKIEAWLVLEGDYGAPSQTISHASETFTLAKTNRVLPAEEPEIVENEVQEEVVHADPSLVRMRAPLRVADSNLVAVSVDVVPPVKRVEFRIEDRRVLARNAPPYTADLDIGASSEPVALHAIGYDGGGRYVDAAAVVANESEPRLGVTITQTRTSDGLSHFKLTVRNAQRLNSVALYAGGRKLREWDSPPYAVSIPTASIAGEPIRATVIDASGAEASDVAAAWSR